MQLTRTRQRKPTSESRSVAQRELEASAAAEASLQASQRMALQRRQLQAAFGPAVQLQDDAAPGPFAQQVEAGADPQALGLETAEPQADAAEAGPVHQFANWKTLGAKRAFKGGSIWVFKDADKAKLALAEELGEEMAQYLEAGDWKLGVQYAQDKKEGADAALKLLHQLAQVGLSKARMAERRESVDDAELRDGIDNLGLGDIATAALQLGVTLYIEGNSKGGIGNSWSETDVNDAIAELNYNNHELVKIANKKKGDTRKGIVICDSHEASNKAEQGKGSIYRGVDVQANVNMVVFGKVIYVHLNVG